MTSWIEYNHNVLNNFRDLTKQNNFKLMTSISTQALYNPYFNLQTTSQFPQHFHSLCYTSYSIFPCFSIWKFRRVVHAFWTPSRQPLDQFGLNLAKLLSDGSPTNFNSSFHFQVVAYFLLAVEMVSHHRIYLLVKMKRRHILEIWDTVF